MPNPHGHRPREIGGGAFKLSSLTPRGWGARIFKDAPEPPAGNGSASVPESEIKAPIRPTENHTRGLESGLFKANRGGFKVSHLKPSRIGVSA